jgi:hypothetical protein
MATSKKTRADHESGPDAVSASQQAAAELLLKRGSVDAPMAGAGYAVPWDTVRTKEELLASLPPLSATGLPGNDDAPSESLTHHNPAPASDRRGAFVEQGNAGRSRVNRSGHKP